MPTINEVWQQVLQINANLGALSVRVDETNDWLGEIRTLVADGLAALSQGLAGIQARQDLTNQLLHHHADQQDTIICILDRISRNTCRLVNEADLQTTLQKALRASSEGIEYMYASVNPEGALALNRERQRRAELEECCPPEPRVDPCMYEPCPFDARQN